MNYFERFDLPVSFCPDQQLLKKKFFALSRQYHPDFFTQENENDQAEALEMSSEVNKGYKILQNSNETIKYVLQLKGMLEEDEKYILQSDFLMEMMELNEQLMDAKMEGNATELASIKQEIATKESEIYLPVKQIIEASEDRNTADDDLLLVKDYYFKKKYLARILDTIV